jgi:hypothetical protein
MHDAFTEAHCAVPSRRKVVSETNGSAATWSSLDDTVT